MFRRMAEVKTPPAHPWELKIPADTHTAPVPRKKEGRAARLAAMMVRDGLAIGSMGEILTTDNTQDSGQENGDTETPNDSAPMTPANDEDTPLAPSVDSEITLQQLQSNP